MFISMRRLVRKNYNWPSLHKKCPYSELFLTAFSRFQTRITLNKDTFYAVLIFNKNKAALKTQNNKY